MEHGRLHGNQHTSSPRGASTHLTRQKSECTFSIRPGKEPAVVARAVHPLWVRSEDWGYRHIWQQRPQTSRSHLLTILVAYATTPTASQRENLNSPNFVAVTCCCTMRIRIERVHVHKGASADIILRIVSKGFKAHLTSVNSKQWAPPKQCIQGFVLNRHACLASHKG
jgi:hypothetical protein